MSEEINKIEKEFDEKVNELRRETHWGYEDESPAHEFGVKVQRNTGFDEDSKELFTIPDWGNIKNFLHSSLLKYRESVLEEIKGKINLHNDRLKSCLKYCQEQNGINYCKNCGLYEQDLIDLSEFKDK